MMEQVNRTYRELCLELLKAWNRSEGGSYSDFGKAAEQIAKKIDAFMFESDSTILQANAPDWRGLCEELYRAFTAHARTDRQHDLLDRAQAALAQSEPERGMIPAGYIHRQGNHWELSERPLLDDEIKRGWIQEPVYRAALTQPEPEVVGPTDEEIMGLMPQQMHEDLAAAVRALAEQEGIDSTPAKGVMRIMLNRHVVDLARAVLARWGRPAPAPAEGEVAEVPTDEKVEAWADDQGFIRGHGDHPCGFWIDDGDVGALVRAALARWGNQFPDARKMVSHPAPVPVAERLPGDALCWWYEPDEDDDGSGYGGNWTLLRIRGAVSYYTHWLPATALPLPSGEVE